MDIFRPLPASEFAESTIMKYAYKWKLTPDPVRRAPLTHSRAHASLVNVLCIEFIVNTKQLV